MNANQPFRDRERSETVSGGDSEVLERAFDVALNALIYAHDHPDEGGGGMIGKATIVVQRFAAAGLLAGATRTDDTTHDGPPAPFTAYMHTSEMMALAADQDICGEVYIEPCCVEASEVRVVPIRKV